jgi:hypothetical protein
MWRLNKGGSGVGVHVDRALHQLEVRPVHRSPSSHRARRHFDIREPDASIRAPAVKSVAGREGRCRRKLRRSPTRTKGSGSNGNGERPAFQVLDRTFAILDLFDEERPDWTATEIARTLDLPVPTTHRILMALKQRGYVSQHEETKRFRSASARSISATARTPRWTSARCRGRC